MDYTLLIKEAAHEQGIDENLYLAICRHESSLNPLAMRYEPFWRYFYFVREYADQIGITVETEQVLQSCSFGLCQIMGSVAREHGFKGNLALLIADPKTALIQGAVHLKSFLQKYGNEADAIAAYNQGSNRKTDGGMYQNQTYVDAVIKILADLRKLKE